MSNTSADADISASASASTPGSDARVHAHAIADMPGSAEEDCINMTNTSADTSADTSASASASEPTTQSDAHVHARAIADMPSSAEEDAIAIDKEDDEEEVQKVDFFVPRHIAYMLGLIDTEEGDGVSEQSFAQRAIAAMLGSAEDLDKDDDDEEEEEEEEEEVPESVYKVSLLRDVLSHIWFCMTDGARNNPYRLPAYVYQFIQFCLIYYVFARCFNVLQISHDTYKAIEPYRGTIGPWMTYAEAARNRARDELYAVLPVFGSLVLFMFPPLLSNHIHY